MFINQPMSKRAYEAVANDKMPMAYWTTEQLGNKIRETWKINPNKYPLPVLRASLLRKTDPHHFGPRYLKTDFFELDDIHDAKTARLILDLQLEAYKNGERLYIGKKEWSYGYITFTSKDSHGRINSTKEFGRSNGKIFVSNDGVKRPISWKKLYSFTELELKEEVTDYDLNEMLNPGFRYSISSCY